MAKRVGVGAVVIALVASIVPHAFAQTEAVFEVAPAKAPRRGTIRWRTPQSINFQAAGVANLIAYAYGFPADRVERRPQWMYDDSYDVAVTTAAPTSLPEQKLLLQKLLEERFGLVVHRYSYPSMVYYLVRGAKVNLAESTEGDSEDQIGAVGLQARSVNGKHMSMSDLAARLYSPLQLPVFDHTGIAGFFDIEIHVTGRGGDEPTIRAVREQLGLDLELHHGTAETLIIDHIEKPRAN